MRISGFEDILYLANFSVEKSCNEHGICTFSGSIDDNEADGLMGRVGQAVQVFWHEGGKEKCVFGGRVEEVRVSKLLHSSTIEVRAVSLSAVEDEKPCTRIWQNPKKKLGQVLSVSSLALSACDLQLSSELAGCQYALPILQNQESNFSFLQRMAEYMEMPLWVEDTKSGKGAIMLAELLSETNYTVEPDEIIRYTVARRKAGQKFVSITLKRYLPFGSRVRISNDSQEYVVYGLHIDLEHESYEFSYQVRPRLHWKYRATSNPHLEKTIYFTGTVENIHDDKNMGRIQVSFHESEVIDMDKDRMWIPYQSPYTGLAGGIVFLPDVGDKVRIIFSNEGIYATAAMRENALADECRKVNEKYIGNNTKQRIFFREKELMLASDIHTIVLDDKKIELSAGESKITLTKERISLQQGKTQYVLDAKGGYISAGENKIAWNEKGIIGKSGKEIGLEAKGQVNIAGNRAINIDAQGRMKTKLACWMK